jgi:hypothetical protein
MRDANCAASFAESGRDSERPASMRVTATSGVEGATRNGWRRGSTRNPSSRALIV